MLRYMVKEELWDTFNAHCCTQTVRLIPILRWNTLRFYNMWVVLQCDTMAGGHDICVFDQLQFSVIELNIFNT